MELSFDLNGSAQTFQIRADTLLLDLIRETGLTGTKEGCGVGVCGLCTVLVDDRPTSSCIYLAACAEGRAVTTIERLAQTDPLLVDVFIRHEALQCGICTPGQMVSCYAFKRAGGEASESAVRTYMAGNLCRCTGYARIIDAVMEYVDE